MIGLKADQNNVEEASADDEVAGLAEVEITLYLRILL